MKMVMAQEGIVKESFNLIINFEFSFLRYDILNLQTNVRNFKQYLHYVQVGTWNTGKLNLNVSSIRFFNDQRSVDQINIRRFCSDTCPVGHVQVSSH